MNLFIFDNMIKRLDLPNFYWRFLDRGTKSGESFSCSKVVELLISVVFTDLTCLKLRLRLIYLNWLLKEDCYVLSVIMALYVNFWLLESTLNIKLI